MATSQTIAPSLGHAPSIIDLGPGAAGEGYSAIDWRRIIGASLCEGILSDGSYAVTAGAGTREISIAAATGDGVVITGDSVAAQGKYLVAPHSAAITLTHDAADATNPRNDLVVLEVLDSVSDAGGSNLARVRIVKGTPNASAVVTDALGSNGTPTLPVSAIPLAVVRIPVGAGVLSSANIDDRRYRTSGKSIIAATETFTQTSYGWATTPDRVRNIVLPTDGLICVGYQAMWQNSVASNGKATLVLNGTSVKAWTTAAASPTAQEQTHSSFTGVDEPLASAPRGLCGVSLNASGTDVSTGQVVGADGTGNDRFGICTIFAAAGTYDVGVQFKSASGSVTVKNRKLWVWTQPFPG